MKKIVLFLLAALTMSVVQSCGQTTAKPSKDPLVCSSTNCNAAPDYSKFDYSKPITAAEQAAISRKIDSLCAPKPPTQHKPQKRITYRKPKTGTNP